MDPAECCLTAEEWYQSAQSVADTVEKLALGRSTHPRIDNEAVDHVMARLDGLTIARLQDQSGFWFSLWGREIKTTTRVIRSGKLGWGAIAVLSYHGDGWIREAAVEAAERADIRVLPFIVARANDWVKPIAERARWYILTTLPKAPADVALKAMPSLFRLKEAGRLRSFPGSIGFQPMVVRASSPYPGVERNIPLIIGEIETILMSRPGLLLAAFEELPARPKRWIAELRLRSGSSTIDSAKALLNSTDPGIRRVAAASLIAHSLAGEQAEIVSGLANDPSVLVRLLALDEAEKLGSAGVPILERLAVDPRWHIRAAARHRLASRGITVDAAYYRARLHDAGAVAGLAETGSAEDAPVMVRLLQSGDSPEIRRQAAWALGQLGVRAFADDLAKALHDPAREVAREAVKSLIKLRGSLSGGLLLELAERRARVALEAMPLAGRWQALRTMLAIAGRREVPSIEARIDEWLVQARTRPMPPSPEDLQAAEQAFWAATPRLSPDLVKRLREEMAMASRRVR
ncbi:MAG TPA: HEAT repeat domain-containing protein [Fimbriimonadaceae bacterium]|nr:HEAT repeat domain-containing protein [Fimbriimonadaceae bacterium]